jgi:hypothetical protein
MVQAMRGRVPAHTQEQNLAALMAGYEIVKVKAKSKASSRRAKQ